MVFSSLTFLYFFLPLTILLYFVCKNRVYRNTVLLLASVLFYSWGEPRLVLLMLAATLIAYLGGLLMHRWQKAGKLKLKKTAFVITTLLLVLNLLYFKYFNFFAENIQFLLDADWQLDKVMLPIGISFYTFQILSYVIDLYWGKVGVQKNFFYLTLYLSFFPQLIAGPIVRYQTVEHEIRNREESLEDVTVGLRRFIIGLAKKVLIANNVAKVSVIVYQGYTGIYGTVMYWLAAIAYALQIYFDFSGYSDMAIGMGRIFGFHFLENFKYPYVSLSITEFWRRWHISLSSWFRDYIYIPMGGNRVNKGRFIINILVVWAVTGFWHGAQWNFILWGVYYGILLLLEKLVLGKMLEKLPRFVRWLYSMFFVLVGWVMFNLTDFAKMLTAFKQMFTYVPTNFMTLISADSEILYYVWYIPLGILCMLPWLEKFKKPESACEHVLCNLICVVLFVISVIFVFSSTYNPFIYFRF